MTDTDLLAENLKQVKCKIAAACSECNRAPESVKLVAVTKTVDSCIVEALYNLGLRDFGENRIHIGLPKVESLGKKDATWHFIGHLQRRKVKSVIPAFTAIHSVDSNRLANSLEKTSEDNGVKTRVMIEVKTSEEEDKLGVTPEDLPELASHLEKCSHLQPIGLMTMAPYMKDPELTRPYFSRLAKMAKELNSSYPGCYTELSMGMSNDFEAAIKEGATIVRIGSALFKDLNFKD